MSGVAIYRQLDISHVKRSHQLPAPASGFQQYNQTMFARKIRLQYQQDGELQLCPLKWLDNFSMRNFTNASVFDDTLPVADGYLEIGTNVPLDQLRDAMEDWFRRKSYLPKNATLVVALV